MERRTNQHKLKVKENTKEQYSKQQRNEQETAAEKQNDTIQVSVVKLLSHEQAPFFPHRKKRSLKERSECEAS